MRRQSKTMAKQKADEDQRRREDLLGGRSTDQGRGSDGEARSVEAMEAEIDTYKAETSASLDRTIEMLQSSKSTAGEANKKLAKQTAQLYETRGTVAQTDQTLIDTEYKLKYGFSWGGAISSTFRRGPKKSPEVTALEGVTPPPGANPSKGAVARAAGASGGDSGAAVSNIAPPKFEGNATTDGTAAAMRGTGQPAAPAYGSQPQPRESMSLAAARPGAGQRQRQPANGPQHGGATAEYDSQLDTIDDLLGDLLVESQQMNARLTEQAPAIEALGSSVEGVSDKAQKQNKQMRRRWKIM